ncbi:PAS domain S-box protein [Haloarculaceae archaeon H-GB1-1]|nr:PAS domain S-box protein [Haloarculaceae archaeon H-GB1-1]
MTRPTDSFEAMTRRMDKADKKRRILYAGLLSAAGLVFAVVQLPHLVADSMEGMGLVALLTGAILPLLLGLVIAGFGYGLWRSDLPAAQLRRVNIWFLFGIGGMAVVSGALIIYELLEGARLSHIEYLFLDFVTAGGIAGILVGWYDANNQRHTKQLQIFQQAVEHGGHCFYLTSPDGTIEYVNSEFEAQTGYTQEEALGRNPRILKSGEQDEAFYEEMWRTILSGDVWQSELVNERKDGTRQYVDQTIAPVMDGQNEIEHFVAINRDITEQKKQKTKLERQNERLDEFASVVSHDLRNPLNVALGRIDVVRNDCESEHLDVAERALDRMERLIDDVLTLARQGETISGIETVSLQTVCEDAWAQIDSVDANLSVQTDQSISADRSRLQQLLENLFRNAIEHGGRNVTISVGRCDGGFYVEDTGEGIPADAREDLFKSGYTTAEDGTGLGLAIVQRIVEAHGWEITVLEGEEGGARFEITGVATSIDTHATRGSAPEIR